MTSEDVPEAALDEMCGWLDERGRDADRDRTRHLLIAARTAFQEAAEKKRRSAYQGEMTWDPPKLMTLELENVHGVEVMNLGHASRPSEVVTALHTAAEDVDAVFLNGGRSE